MPPALPRIAIGSDHGGFDVKTALADWLRSRSFPVSDLGTRSKASVDYPVYAAAVARAVASGRCDIGIMIDGAGIGSAMAANKIPGVRAAACYNVKLATNSRQHNGANLLTLGAGQNTLDEMKAIIDAFLANSCTEDRHLRRVQMIKDLESGRANAPVLAALKEINMDLTQSDVARIASRVKELIGSSPARPGFGPCRRDPASTPDLGPAALAHMIDHTLLKPEATEADIRKLCGEALKYNFWSCCVNSAMVPIAAQALRGSPVKVCCVVGFPLGACPSQIKAMEARRAIREGAREVDMVIDVGLAKSGNWEAVYRDIRTVAESVKDGGALLKVILETCLLTPDEIVKACEASLRARADYVKTSTGFNKGGAKVPDVALMSQTVGHKLGVKASGGIHTYDEAMSMVRAGATRLGVSASVKIIEEAIAKGLR